MRRFLIISPLLFQLVISFLILTLVFTLFFISNANENTGIVAGLGFEKSRAIFGLIIIVVSIAICFILGLPIRIIPALNQWWTYRPAINLVILVSGLLLIFFFSGSFFSGDQGITLIQTSFSRGGFY